VWCNSLGHGGRQGAFAEYALVAAYRLYPVPDGLDRSMWWPPRTPPPRRGWRCSGTGELLAHGGRLVAMVGLRSEPVLPIGRLHTRDASIVGFAISNATVPDLADAAAGVVELLHTTPWRPRIADRVPFAADYATLRAILGPSSICIRGNHTVVPIDAEGRPAPIPQTLGERLTLPATRQPNRSRPSSTNTPASEPAYTART
jgi:hypothetical protein